MESRYQNAVIKKLRKMFPGCYILKNDPTYIQGIPDLIVLWQDRWAMLEVKASVRAPHQPNQEWYITQLDKLSFAAFIYPENEEAVLNELHSAFTHASSSTRIPQPK